MCPCCGSNEITYLGQLGRRTWGRCVICGTDVDLTDRIEDE